MASGSLKKLEEGFDLIPWYEPKRLGRFANADNIKALMDGVSESRNEMLDALKEISLGYQLVRAEGIQLDIIGLKFNVTRNGDSDGVLRARIAAFGSLKISGTVNQVIFVLKALGYGTLGQQLNQIRVHQLWNLGGEPAAFVVVLTDPSSAGDPEQSQLEAISPAGVGVYQGWFLELESEPGEYVLLEDDNPGDGVGTPILVY